MKGKEVQRRTRTDISTRTQPGTPDVYDEHDAYIPDVRPYNDSYSVVYDVPEWCVPVPTYTQGAGGIKAAIERWWSWIMRYPRYLALGFLWVTVNPWRFFYVTITIVLVIFVLVSKG